jgi:enamine deaminase RidA (YjgF/YER057c/UK114 family)
VTERFREGVRFEEVAGYSRAVRVGNRVLVSGTADLSTDGTVVHAGDTYEQTVSALRRGLAAVEALGGAREDVVRTRLYLTPDASWEDAARAHKAVLRDIYPANTTLYVASFPAPGALVEVEVEAEVGAGQADARERGS